MFRVLRVVLTYLELKIGSKDSPLTVICFRTNSVNPCAGSVEEENSPPIYICMQFEHWAA